MPEIRAHNSKGIGSVFYVIRAMPGAGLRANEQAF
jgi:hypothetical protein